ncbi:MAG: tagatose-bisphosphate aldolase, partial [Anaerolineae bacterium]|nr:tagatose-bisphosphate aldolase [Anaerolineae bacterium]
AVPWTLLSAGVDYPTFRRQTEFACRAGASGVIVGRAVWAEAVRLQGEARDHFLSHEAAARIRELGELCAAYGTDWRQKVSLTES